MLNISTSVASLFDFPLEKVTSISGTFFRNLYFLNEQIKYQSNYFKQSYLGP